mgnify:CR=1 FL=1
MRHEVAWKFAAVCWENERFFKAEMSCTCEGRTERNANETSAHSQATQAYNDCALHRCPRRQLRVRESSPGLLLLGALATAPAVLAGAVLARASLALSAATADMQSAQERTENLTS